jgi:hypothetical protein
MVRHRPHLVNLTEEKLATAPMYTSAAVTAVLPMSHKCQDKVNPIRRGVISNKMALSTADQPIEPEEDKLSLA